MSLFHPTILKNRITDLSTEELQAMGVKAVLLDVDNTLTRHHSQELPEAVDAWLRAVQESGIRCMLVSNSKRPRIDPFAARIGLPYIHTAVKPLPFGFRRAVKTLGVTKGECLAIGDQTFTDVLGARLCGIRVTQLIPIEEETGWSFRVRRRLEKGVLARYRKKQERRDRR
ncbi:MAG: YqeG family HAD IIIA-type phosphatase [Clostridia bacterium]|nr:YqeG family HAD IIIA-type phosphatase [Clostridia bacterium]MBQ4616960.1 YqeG family HAD IIIA-type phosphatase [Clostridia bacterium]